MATVIVNSFRPEGRAAARLAAVGSGPGAEMERVEERSRGKEGISRGWSMCFPMFLSGFFLGQPPSQCETFAISID